MMLAAPIMLAGLTALVPIVLLYLVKPKPRLVPTATLQFWQLASPPKASLNLGRKLRTPLSLLLAILLAVLLSFAMAEPVRSGPAEPMVIVLDNSATMAAPGRWEQAKAAAKAKLANLREKQPAAIVLAAEPPRVLCPWTTDALELIQAIDGAKQSDAPRKLPEAMALAKRLAEANAGTITTISDIDAEGETIRVGSSTANAAIVQFTLRRRLQDPSGFELFVQVANYANEAFDGRLVLSLDGTALGNVPVKIAANGLWQEAFGQTVTAGGLVEAKLEPADDLPADNAAIAILPALETLAIDLVASRDEAESVYLENALLASPLAGEVKLRNAARSGAVAVYFGSMVPEVLPRGAVLVVNPRKDTDLFRVKNRENDPAVKAVKPGDPLIAAVKPQLIRFGVIPHLAWKPPGPVTVIATAFDDEPSSVLSHWERPEGAGRIVVLNAELEPRFVFSHEYVVLMNNALSWLGGMSDEPTPSMPAGTHYATELPKGLWSIKCPRGGERSIDHAGGMLDFGTLDEIGLWEARCGNRTHRVSCNAAAGCDPRVEEATSENAAKPRWWDRPVWFILVLAALALVTLEWALYQRRWIA